LILPWFRSVRSPMVTPFSRVQNYGLVLAISWFLTLLALWRDIRRDLHTNLVAPNRAFDFGIDWVDLHFDLCFLVKSNKDIQKRVGSP
jgi:hypothetical protein